MRVIDKAHALDLLAGEASDQPRGNPCWMCTLAAMDEDDIHLIARNHVCTVVLNRFGQRAGHLMVIANAHVENMHELPWSQMSALQEMAHAATQALVRTLQPVRVFNAALGSPSTRPNSSPHVHVHLVPLHESDDRARPARVFSWSEGVVIYDDAEARALTQRIRHAMPTPPTTAT